MKKLLIMLFLLFSLSTVEVSAEGNTLFVHYYRYDENYEDWNLWLWPNQPVAGNGSAYEFTGEDAFGKVLELDVSTTNLEDASRIGVIVRLGNWDAKDVEKDRFFDVEYVDGEMHIYLVQATEEIFLSRDSVDTSNKIFSAKFLDDNTVEFVATTGVDAEDITIYEGDTEFEIATVYAGGTKRRFDVANPLDLSKVYTLEVDFGSYTKSIRIDLSGLFTTEVFNDSFEYDGALGVIYSETETTFRLWAPVSETATLNLYNFGHPSSIENYDGVSGDDTPYETHEMTKKEKGVLEVTVPGDLHGKYYTFTVNDAEVVDPYATAVGVNGDRGMVLNFDLTDPVGWENDTRPELGDYMDSVLYELHVRDLTTHEAWNGPEELRGTYLGLVYEGTEFENISTGIDHIKELGVTTVHLLPVFDYAIVDETRLKDPTYQNINDGSFNWGYMPENFNAVEGSYSTNPYDGAVRVTEFKEMVMAFHEAGIRVVMDVVYNHTGYSADSNFHQIFPGYYHRMNGENFSNGSGTGNETASERAMVKNYIVDSVEFWATEYNIDGFRFDLMKLHDVQTMNEVVEVLHEIDDTIIVYGEPWDAGGSQLDGSIAAQKSTVYQMPHVAIFNDATRDGVKGSVFDEEAIGFVQGSTAYAKDIMLGIVAGVKHGQIQKLQSFAIAPDQIINYVTAHDNNTLYDKLKLSSEATDEEIINMIKQANAIVLTSQGTPFLHAGVEFARTKPCIDGECDANNLYDHNSYRSPDSTNQIDWNLKVENQDLFNYVQGLIELRKAHPAFSLDDADDIARDLLFVDETDGNFIQYILAENVGGDEWRHIMVVHNSGEARDVELLGGTWNVVVNQDQAGTEIIETVTSIEIKKNETLVLYTEDTLEGEADNGLITVPTEEVDPDPVDDEDTDTEDHEDDNDSEDHVDDTDKDEDLNIFQRFWRWLKNLFK